MAKRLSRLNRAKQIVEEKLAKLDRDEEASRLAFQQQRGTLNDLLVEIGGIDEDDDAQQEGKE